MGRSGRFVRILLKVLAVVLAIAIVTPFVAVAFLRTDRGHELLRRLVVAQARKSVPGLALGRLEGGLLRDLELRDVEVRDAQGGAAVHVDRLRARYRLLPLLRHRVVVDDLEVDGLRIQARPDPRGGLNLAHLTSPTAPETTPRAPEERSGSTWAVAVEHVRVDGVSATLETPDGAMTSLTRLRVEGGARLEGRDAAAWVEQLAARAEAADRAVTVALEDTRIDLHGERIAAKVGALRVGGLLPDGQVVSVTAQANGPRDRVDAHVEARAGAAGDVGEVVIDGTVGLRDADGGGTTLGAYALVLKAAGLDPAALAPGAPVGRVSLSVRAVGDGVPLAKGAHADVDLQLLPTELAGERLLGGRVRANLRDDRWEVSRSELRALGVSLTMSGHGRERTLVADLEAKIDGARSRDARRMKVRGRGQLAIHAAGTIGGKLSVEGHGGVVGLAAGDVRVGRADLALDVRGTLDAPSGNVSVVATQVTLARGAPAIDRANVKVSGDRGRVQLLASARGRRLRATIAAHGMATPQAGDVTVDQLALDVATHAFRQQVTLMEPTRVRYRADGAVMLARTVINGEGAQFTGQAVLEGEYDPRAAPRAPLGQAVLQLAKASTRGLPPVNAALRATLTRQRGTVHLDASMPSAAAHVLLDADVPVDVPRRGPPKLASQGSVNVHLTTNKVQLRALPVVPALLARQGIMDGTVSLDLTAAGEIAHPEAHVAFEVRDVMYRKLAGLGRDSTLKTVPGLGGSLKVDAKDGSIKADARLLIRNAGVLDVHATLPIELGTLLAGVPTDRIPLQATVDIPTFRLASLADFTDGWKGVDGKLRGRIDVKGTLKHPSGRADLAVDDALVDKLRFKQVSLHAEADRDIIRARLAVEEVTGGRLDGSLTLEHGNGDRFEAYVTGKDLNVAFVRAFAPNVREIGGVAQLSVTAKGTPGAPHLWASLTLEKGLIGVIDQPTFRDLRLAVALKPGRLDVSELQMSSGGGQLRGNGWVTLAGPRGLTPQAAVFRAHANRFLVAVAGSSGARVDGELAFDAALRADVLAGTVKIPNANVWLLKTPSATGGGSLQKVGPHGDVHFVDATAKAAAARELEKKHQAAGSALRVALKATASPVYVRGKDLDLEVRSNVEIGTEASGPHKGAVTLAGAIHIPRGRLNLQGQRFDVDHANMTFDGSSDINPALDIKLTRQYPEALVVIELRGTPRKPQLRLSSDPGIYDQAQIVSLILTGQTGSQPSNGKPFDATSAVTTAVLSRLADQVAPELGLDVMRVEKQDVTNAEGQATGASDTRVEVGKYVSERIYVSYAHIFAAPSNANQNEAHLEYRMTRRWMLETIFGDAGQGSLDALWTFRF